MRGFLSFICFLVCLLAVHSTARSQTRERLSGWCEQGNYQVTTDGRQSTTRVQRSFSLCTVTVFDAGTSNLSTIASDYGGTPKANPFTADVTGFWDFFGVEGRYDVRLTGSGIPAPFTLPGLWIRTAQTTGAPTGATYLTLTNDATLTNERVLTAGPNITFTDTGANGTLTINAAPTNPGNPANSVQFNDGGLFNGDTGFLYNKTTDTISLGVSSSTTGIIDFKSASSTFTTSVKAGTATSSFSVLLFPDLPSSGNECVRISSTGQLTRTGFDCGAAGGTIGGSGTVPQVAYFSSAFVLSSSPGIVFNTATQATITTPRIVTSLRDTNDAGWILVGSTASAVNNITVTNAATGAAPLISATGSNSNVNLDFVAKGTGELRWRSGAFSIPVTLSDVATIATDASLSNRFSVTIGGNRTLGNPTNMQDGQQVVWTIIQNGTGGWTLSFDTKFVFGVEITSCLINSGANKRSFITGIYASAPDKIYIVGCVTGY